MKIAGIVLLAALVLAIVTSACRVEIFTVTTRGATAEPAAESVARRAQPASRAEAVWIEQVSAACSDLSAELGRLRSPTNRAGLRRYLRHVAALERSFVVRIGSLEPPPMYAVEARHAFASRRDWQRGFGRLVRAVVTSGQTKAVLAAGTALEDLARRTNVSFESLGLTQCLLPSSGIPG